MSTPTTATYGVLGMLATRPWTGYELTRQMRRSLRFVWATSEAHLYREQKKLVALGWAIVEDEQVGRRKRQCYSITPAGRAALRAWLKTDPDEPHLQVEGILRAFYADSAEPEDVGAALRATASSASRMLEELAGYAEEYLSHGGPMDMLEGKAKRGPFGRREMYPERLPAVALALEATTRLLAEIESFSSEFADEVAQWGSTSDVSLAATTRERLERARRRAMP